MLGEEKNKPGKRLELFRIFSLSGPSLRWLASEATEGACVWCFHVGVDTGRDRNTEQSAGNSSQN